MRFRASEFCFVILTIMSLCAAAVAGCGLSSSGEGSAAGTAQNPPTASNATTLPQSESKSTAQPAKQSASAAQPEAPKAASAAAAVPARKSAPSAKPASLRAAAEAINLAELAGPRGAEFQERTVGSAMVKVPLSIADAFEFYTKALTERGWREETEGNYRQVAAEYAQNAMSKNGFLLTLFVSASGDEKNPSQVTIRNQGNVDTRNLPAPAGSKLLYGSAGTTIYTCEGSVADATETCRRELIKQGWQPFGPAFAATAESDEQKFLTLKNGGIELSVMVGLAPAQGNKTSIQYNTMLLEGELPWPADAEEVEFDDGRLYLTFKSSAKMTELIDFYREQLAGLAWSSRSEFDKIYEKSAALYFDDAERNRLAVGIDVPDEGPRRVRVERYTAAELAAIEERARRNELASQEAEKPSSEPSADEPKEERKAQVDPKSIKLPKTAKGVDYDADAAEIKFTTTEMPTKVAEFFRDQLVGETWKEDRRFSVVTDEAAVFEFHGGGASLNFTLIRFPDADGTRVTIAGDGLAWNGKPAAETEPAQIAADEPSTNDPTTETPAEEPAETKPAADEELTAEDKDGFPIPSGYTGYSTEKTPFRRTINVTTSASLTKVAEFYRRELSKGGWKESGDAAIADDKAALEFTGPQGPLSVKLKRENDETQVELFTRSAEAAKKAGILPKPGKARLIFGNTLKSDVTLDVDGKKIKVRAGEGEQKPDGPSLDVAPGKHKLSATIDGKTTSDEIEVEADQTWGVIVLDGGALPLLMY